MVPKDSTSDSHNVSSHSHNFSHSTPDQESYFANYNFDNNESPIQAHNNVNNNSSNEKNFNNPAN